MTASYSTIPAGVEPAKTSLKRLFVVSAVTSFVLGVLAATALEGPIAPAVMELDDLWNEGYCDGIYPTVDNGLLCDGNGGPYPDAQQSFNNQGNVEDFRLVLSLRQFGPDGQLTYTEDFNEVNFYPVTTDGDSRVW